VTQKSPSAPSPGTVGVGPNARDEGSKQTLEAELRSSQFLRATRESGITGELPRLKYSRVEANSIMELSPSDSRLEILGFAASKAAASSPSLSQYQIVLFATHGLLDSQHPELSGVVLSTVDERGAQVDGFLTLHDIYNLTLPAELRERPGHGRVDEAVLSIRAERQTASRKGSAGSPIIYVERSNLPLALLLGRFCAPR
jgi:hypothetical protein